jgi:hypothetical protein
MSRRLPSTREKEEQEICGEGVADGGGQAGATHGEGAKNVHCKKSSAVFPSPAGMSLTKLSLDGKNLIIPVKGEFGE